MTLDDYLRNAAARLGNSATPQLDARVIARHVLGLDAAGLILAGPAPIGTAHMRALGAAIARRAMGEPVAYIAGEKEFFGLTFRMAPGVLIPRPETETVVSAALRRRDKDAGLRILDLGTGSGAILCALLKEFPAASGVGVDINPEAARLAAENAAALGLSARAAFACADWSDLRGETPGGGYDIMVANPPYIAVGEAQSLARDIRDFEDPGALFAGPDGLDAYRSLLALAPRLIAPAGLIILELGLGQDREVAAMAAAAFAGAGLSIDPDLAGVGRALCVDLAGVRGEKSS